MKINIYYCSTKWFDARNINEWIWGFKKYKYVKGVIVRLFGITFNIREKNATQKLIAKFKKI